MARKKGATKTKSSGGGGGRKAATETKQTDKRDAKVKGESRAALFWIYFFVCVVKM